MKGELYKRHGSSLKRITKGLLRKLNIRRKRYIVRPMK